MTWFIVVNNEGNVEIVSVPSGYQLNVDEYMLVLSKPFASKEDAQKHLDELESDFDNE